MHQLTHLNVIEVGFGSAAPDDRHFLNKRAWMWSGMKDWLMFGSIAKDEALENGSDRTPGRRWVLSSACCGMLLLMSLDYSKDADCVLCRKPARFEVGFDYTPFECERCGRFKMSFEREKEG